MVILVSILTSIVYLMGARGTFGFLKRKNYAKHARTYAFLWPVWMPVVFLYKVVTARW